MKSNSINDYLKGKEDLAASLIKTHVKREVLHVHNASTDSIECDILVRGRVYTNIVFTMSQQLDAPMAYDEPWEYVFYTDLNRKELDNKDYVSGAIMGLEIIGLFFGHPETDLSFEDANFI